VDVVGYGHSPAAERRERAGIKTSSLVAGTAKVRPFLPFGKPYFLDVSVSRQVFRGLARRRG
jgi:hypothetical protein